MLFVTVGVMGKPKGGGDAGFMKSGIGWSIYKASRKRLKFIMGVKLYIERCVRFDNGLISMVDALISAHTGEKYPRIAGATGATR